MMILIVDNFDSFTFSIVQAFQQLGSEVKVVRAQSLSANDCLNLNPKAIVIGPGPGAPFQASLSHQLIQRASPTIPLLGICLGHQAIAEHFGGIVKQAHYPMHGKISSISHTNEGVFQDLPQNFNATRYHSLIVDQKFLPSCLKVTAWTEEDIVMGIKHRYLPIEGIQFHPESILTEYGLDLLKRFVQQTTL